MIFTSEQREQVRLSLLRYGNGLGRFTLGLARQYLIGEGFSGISSDQVRAEIEYLHEKGFLLRVEKAISPENPQWKTSADGRDFLAMQGQENDQ